jgi:citrate synthase
MKSIIDGFPKTAHPMGVLSALTSALTAFNPKSVNVEKRKCMRQCVKPWVNSWLLQLGRTEKYGLSFELL